MRTPNEPTDDFTLPPAAPKQHEPKPETWRPAETPGFLVNEQGQLKTDLPEKLTFTQTERERRMLALVRPF